MVCNHTMKYSWLFRFTKVTCPPRCNTNAICLPLRNTHPDYYRHCTWMDRTSIYHRTIQRMHWMSWHRGRPTCPPLPRIQRNSLLLHCNDKWNLARVPNETNNLYYGLSDREQENLENSEFKILLLYNIAKVFLMVHPQFRYCSSI